MLFRDTSLDADGFFVTATSTQAATTSMVFPAVTTATDESLVVLAVAQDTDAASTATVGALTNANLANLTERHDQTVIAGQGGGLAVITGEKATAGATGTSTATGSTSVTHAYHTISLSRIAAQTTTSNFNTVAGTAYFPISDALRITAGSGGTVNATSSGTFQPNTLTNGTYGASFKWYWRQLGTDAWTTSTAVGATTSALVSLGALDTVGEFTDNETVTGLTNGVEYEFVLFAARGSSTPTNTISFSATATVALPAAAFTITGDAGSFTYSGNNANTLFNRKLVSETMAQTYSGNNANVLFNRKIVADVGAYTYNGNNANTLFNRDLIADAGSFTYSGNDATLTYVGGLNNYSITADAGSFTYSGNNANVLFNRKVVAEAGTYTYAGNNANVLFNRKVVAEAGGYTYAGNSANTIYNRKVVAEAGAYTYSGNNSGLLYNRKLVADTGTYTYSGDNASLVYGTVGAFTLTADTGSFSYNGSSANLVIASQTSQLWLGPAQVTTAYLGSTTVSKAYLGTTRVL
jgi:hypothetical protein